MLQRIQTVYLLITFVLSSLLFFIPFAGLDFVGSNSEGVLLNEYVYKVIGLRESVEVDGVVTSSWYAISAALLALEIVVLLCNIVGIGLYKNRIFQMRFNTLSILLNLGFYPLFFLFAWSSSERLSAELNVDFSIHYYLPIVFPLINMLLTYLAIRAIGKDEALIRSLDRIR